MTNFTIDTLIALASLIVGIIALVVGGTAHYSLSKKTNSLSKSNLIHSSVTQAQTVNNGMSDLAVLELSAKAAKEEVDKIGERITQYAEEINRLEQQVKNDMSGAEAQFNAYSNKVLELEKRLKEMPKIHASPHPPSNGELKDGDIWIQYI